MIIDILFSLIHVHEACYFIIPMFFNLLSAREVAKTEKDFDSIRDSTEFKDMIN